MCFATRHRCGEPYVFSWILQQVSPQAALEVTSDAFFSDNASVNGNNSEDSEEEDDDDDDDDENVSKTNNRFGYTAWTW